MKGSMPKVAGRASITTKDVFGGLSITLLFVGMFLGLEVWVGSPRLLSFPRNLLGIPFLVTGLGLSSWCLRTVATIPPSEGLVTWGPWGRVRHPIYLAGLLINLGASLLIGTVLLFGGFALHAIAEVLGARLEERWLQQRLGPEYTAYQQAVPRWLPRLSSSHQRRR